MVLNLAALVEERVKEACQQHSGLGGDEVSRRLWGPGARIGPATSAAVPPTFQLLLRHLQSSLSVLSQCQLLNLLNSLLAIRVKCHMN